MFYFQYCLCSVLNTYLLHYLVCRCLHFNMMYESTINKCSKICVPLILIHIFYTQVLHFDHDKFKGSIFKRLPNSDFRRKDWGSAPRWVAFVDFFLASRARYAVVSGAHRRVGTTYAQLVAALAAAYNLGISPNCHILSNSCSKSSWLDKIFLGA